MAVLLLAVQTLDQIQFLDVLHQQAVVGVEQKVLEVQGIVTGKQ